MSAVDPLTYFGLSCPQGGNFYICDKSEKQFLGCCRSDPCNHNGGECPADNLRVASFSADMYDELKGQSCNDTRSLWYTCTGTNPPFMGCCSTNPCKELRCPDGDLYPAILSGDLGVRDSFLHPTKDASSTSSSPSQTSTSSSSQDNGLSGGAIAGIVVGVACACISFCFLALLIYKSKARRQHKNNIAGSYAQPSPGLPNSTPHFPNNTYNSNKPFDGYPSPMSNAGNFAPYQFPQYSHPPMEQVSAVHQGQNFGPCELNGDPDQGILQLDGSSLDASPASQNKYKFERHAPQ